MALTLAGSTAALAYLDAKYHFRKDIRALFLLRSATKEWAAAAARNERSLWYAYEAQYLKMPRDFPCLWGRDTGNVSWGRVYEMACQYGNWLKDEMGVRPGEYIAFYLINSVEMFVAILGCWSAGIFPSMINYNLSGEGLVHCLRTGLPKLVLVDEDSSCQARMEEVREVVTRDRLDGGLQVKIVPLDRVQKVKIARASKQRPADELRRHVKDTDPSILLFTSGTTGFPKASKFHVARIFASTGPRALNIGAVAGPGPDTTRFYCCMPIYHGTAFTAVLMAITSGMTACIGRKFSTSAFWDDIRAADATAFVYVGETARYLLGAKPDVRDKQHRVKMMFGNGLRPDVWEKFRERFGVEIVSEFFNSTEGVMALSNARNRGPFAATAVGHHGLLLRRMLHNVYIPVAVSPLDNSIIRSPTTGFATRAAYTTGGEILVRVPSTNTLESGFAGYVGNEAATASKFARDVFEKGDLFYRSGDALRRDDDGRWYFLDRLGDTYRWHSENVSTAEVAERVGRFEGIVEANVYGVLVPKHDGRAGCAAIFLNRAIVEQQGGQAAYFAKLLAYLRKHLPKYAVPVFLRVVDAEEAGPQMHNNKQNKVPLREEGIDLDKIRNGKMSGDVLFWATVEAQGYQPFGEREYAIIEGGKARL